MFIDSRLEFSDAQAETTAATHNSDFQIDLEVARDMGAGQPLYLVVVVDTAVTSAGAATVTFNLVSDASAAIATNGTQTTHASSGAIGKDDLTAGTIAFQVALPIEGNAYERYLGVQYVIGTAALTAGAFSAFLTTTPHKIKAYADAI